jgi:hypothetical protein
MTATLTIPYGSFSKKRLLLHHFLTVPLMYENWPSVHGEQELLSETEQINCATIGPTYRGEQKMGRPSASRHSIFTLLPLILGVMAFSGCSTADSETDSNSNADNTDDDTVDGQESSGDTTDSTGHSSNIEDSEPTENESDDKHNDALDSDTLQDSESTDGSDDNVCESTSASASWTPVYLAFAFDVSGSMGEEDKPWHDPELKWEPVVEATTSFLTDPLMEGMFASMTFFPSHRLDRCEAESYEEPDVSFTALPSVAFSDALTAIREDGWMGSTPTSYVLEGLRTFITEQKAVLTDTSATFAIVLVTDGYPQGCDDVDISTVVDVAEDIMVSGIKTYVIGVNNPSIEDAPDTLDNLHLIAKAGGTGQAFIIATGDPTQTTSDFRAAVDDIRGSAFSCNLDIPHAPEGSTFDRANVRVRLTGKDSNITLEYDGRCETENAWRYNDMDHPTQISLCESTCELAESWPEAALDVEFTCESVIFIE